MPKSDIDRFAEDELWSLGKFVRRPHVDCVTGPLICFALSALLYFAICHSTSAAGIQFKTEANVAAEIAFTAHGKYSHPFDEVILDVVFTDPAGARLQVPAFWAGTNKWKVRYASPLLGKHQFKSECNESDDTGLHHLEGELEVVTYSGINPLFKHGPVRIAKDKRHFAYADGTPFFWMGDTWWMGLCNRLKWPGEFKTLAVDRAAKGFNVVQIVAGLYPDMPAFDPRGANESGFPWLAAWREGPSKKLDLPYFTVIDPQYFDSADLRLQHLISQGITPCLVGAWGYFLPWMGVEKAKQHWRYLIARYGAWPMLWCAAGEANLPYYLAKGFPYNDRAQVKGWSEVMRYIRETDPYHRPLSIHPTGLGRLSARGVVEDAGLLDFDMLQTGHGGREILAQTIDTVRDSYADNPTMPVINSEVCFEMLGDNLPADVVRLMFWASVLSGAAGHTYGANGIWQCNRLGQPHGASPHGANYGSIPWDDAMNLPGAKQVTAAARFLQSLPWDRFEPRADSVAWSGATPRQTWGDWIWFPEGDPRKDAPAATRCFRRTFDLPSGLPIKRAQLLITADNGFTVWINGQELGSSTSWQVPKRISAGALLKPGTNLVAVLAKNDPGPSGANPAGLLASLQIEMSDGTSVSVLSDATWLAAKTPDTGWTNATAFDDSGWEHAKVIAKYGDGPWGAVGSTELAVTPLASGIGDDVRVIYVPDPKPIRISRLQPNAQYRLTGFDPVTGNRSNRPGQQTDADGNLLVEPPQSGADWALLLERGTDR